MKNDHKSKSYNNNSVWWAIIGLSTYAVLMLIFDGQIAITVICAISALGLAFDATRKQEKELILMAAAAAAAAALFGTGSGIIGAGVGVTVYVVVRVLLALVIAMDNLITNSRQE